jgi:hypothetical protein
MDELADRLDDAAATLSRVGRSLPDLGVPAAAFAADDAGLPGRLGRALHTHWDGVLTARAREAADAAGSLTDTAGAVRRTARAYDLADEAAARRLRWEP